MEIPLTLRAEGEGRLVYALPGWYRAVMALSEALVLGSLAVSGGVPGIAGWIVIAIIALAGFYEERWTFDAGATRAAHRAGLLFLARETKIDLASITALRLSAFIRGSVPGSEEERVDKEAALALGRTDDSKKLRAFHKRAYLNIVIETADGSSYLVNMVDARKGAVLREAARRIAEHCGKPLIEG